MRRLHILTNSAEKTWRSCPRQYLLAYEQNIKPLLPGEALVFGDLIHKALEAWWKSAKSNPHPMCMECGVTGRIEPRSEDAAEPCNTCDGRGFDKSSWLRAALKTIEQDEDPFRRSTLEALILGYHEQWKAMTWDGAPIEVLDVECEFTGPLLNPATGKPSKTWARGGKIDVLVRVGGRAWVIEHKSTAEDFAPGSDYRRRLRLDTQVSGYHVGARLLGHEDVAGVIYDVIGKPGLRPLKATPPEKRKYTKGTKADPVPRLYAGQRETDETPDEYQARLLESIAGGGYYARFEVLRLEHEEEEAARDTWQRADEIRDARRLGRWPRNPSSCTQYNRPCAYLPVCEGTATVNDGTRYRKAESAHEELNEVKHAA